MNNRTPTSPFRNQLLKWVGNKQRFAHQIIDHFPPHRTYREPFLGSGAVLGTLAPPSGYATDISEPLIGIWKCLQDDPEKLNEWYTTRWNEYTTASDRKETYEHIKHAYNTNPNPADLLFLSRTCYGGIIRFRKKDGHMSTPCGPHNPISPETFRARTEQWHQRTKNTRFETLDYKTAIAKAEPGDLIYCDPPYTHSQTILYGAQDFNLQELFHATAEAKEKGIHVAISIDGNKKTGDPLLHLDIPDGLFPTHTTITTGRSHLKRLQMPGENLQNHIGADRLLTTWHTPHTTRQGDT